MYPLSGINVGPPNPNTVYKHNPAIKDRYCETCMVQWRGEIGDRCWSCDQPLVAKQETEEEARHESSKRLRSASTTFWPTSPRRWRPER
jgi:hypothetical protein